MLLRALSLLRPLCCPCAPSHINFRNKRMLIITTTPLLLLRTLSHNFRNKRMLIIGGSGRVGGSTVRALRQIGRERGWNLQTDVGGRNEANYQKAKARWINEFQTGDDYDDVGFVALDHEDPSGLKAILSKHKPDLIIHTAGPFQRKKDPVILKASLDLKIPYVDGKSS